MLLLSADDSTLEIVHTLRKHAHTDISVPDASNGGTERVLVQREVDLMHDHQLRYLHYNSWHEGVSFSPCTANWTLHAPLIPPPLTHELKTPVTAKIIAKNPHLFKIVTPININCFKELLKLTQIAHLLTLSVVGYMRVSGQLKLTPILESIPTLRMIYSQPLPTATKQYFCRNNVILR